MNEITQLLHIDPLLLQALREDIPEEDVSTNAVMPHACPGTVDLIAKEDGIVAGLAVYARVFTLLDPALFYGRHHGGSEQPHSTAPAVCLRRDLLQRCAWTQSVGQQFPAGIFGLCTARGR